MCENYCKNFYGCCPYTNYNNLSSNYCCEYLKKYYPPQCQPSECTCQLDIMPVSFRKIYNMPSKAKQFSPTIDLSLGDEDRFLKPPKLKKRRKSIGKDKEDSDGTRKGSKSFNVKAKKKLPKGDTADKKSTAKDKKTGKGKKSAKEKKSEDEENESEETQNDDKKPKNEADNCGCLPSPSDRMCKSDSNLNCDNNIRIYKCCCKPVNTTCNCNDTSPQQQSCSMTFTTGAPCVPASCSCESQNSSAYSNCIKSYNDYIMNTVRKACQGIPSNNSCCQPKPKTNTMNCCCTLQRSPSQAPRACNSNSGSGRCNCRKTAGRPKRFKNVTPLGVIDEEEMENEVQKEKDEKNAQNADAMINDMQKSLENSCTDLLNIVTDNILESVQKYVSKTLQDYCCKTTQKIEQVCQKLERAQQTMCCLYGNMVEEITEKNQNSLNQVLELLSELKEAQNNNKQDTGSKVFYEHRESQCDVERDPIVMKRAVVKPGAMTKPGTVAKAGPVTKPTAVAKSGVQAKANENMKVAVNNDQETTKICQCCPACGGNRKTIVKTVIVHKSFSSSTIIQNPICCDSMLDLTEDPCDEDQCEREKGGGTEELKIEKKESSNSSESSTENRNLSEMEALYVREKSVELFNRFAGKTTLDENSVNFKPNISLNAINNNTHTHTNTTNNSSAQVTPSSTRPSSPNTFTCFSIKPTGKTVFNCNCHSEKPISTESKAVDTSELYLYENYDTSGYASEPDDDNDINASIDATKEIPKTLPVRLQYVPRDNTLYSEIPISIKSKVKKPTKRRSSKVNGSKAPPSTPTRLSRL